MRIIAVIAIILLVAINLRHVPGRISWLYALGFVVGFGCGVILCYKP